MDPEACLKEIRRLKDAILASDTAGDCATELCEHIEALDEWLTRGGFLPVQWRDREESFE